MEKINLNKKVTSIEVADDKIIINLEQKYVPKDGEYFYVESKTGNEFIAIKKDDSYRTTRYCSCKNKEYLFIDDDFICENSAIEEIRPATKEERELLDKVLEENGKRWNPETKQIEKLPKVGDFCIFWDFGYRDTRCGILEEVDPTRECPYLINHGIHFKNCIPFESAEHFKEFIKH